MNEYLEDQNITCKDCRQPFVFTGGEQKFFSQQGFNAPVRCKGCRDARKQQRPAVAPSPTNAVSNFSAAPEAAPPRQPRPVVYEPPPKAPSGRKRNNGGGNGRRNQRDYENWED